MVWKWFGVKTLFRWEAIGKRRSVDESYHDDATLVEERIVLIRARSFDEAIKKGEKEAENYSAEYKSFYGQKVKQRYLKVCDAFELFDEPNESGVEVFSLIETVSKKIEDSVIIENKFGKDENIESFNRKREKFWNAELFDRVDNEIIVRKK
ncbi:MAG TPA: DUF4288 domain-containing protein [Pyrinomonadaceae bacterium]|nr:DUF4288 domain-containing protein [Pyrinomonadaceae bacterium]